MKYPVVPHTEAVGTNCTPVQLMLTVPPVIAFSPVIQTIPHNTLVLSTSVSLLNTLTIPVILSNTPPLRSANATGASLTQVTFIVPVAILLPSGPYASLSWNLNVAVPQKFTGGV